LFLYFLTGPHQNSAGCSSVPRRYVLADFNWTDERFLAERSTLIEAELIRVDDETEEVLIERWFKHNKPTNPKHHAGAQANIDNVRSTTLREIAQAALLELSPFAPRPPATNGYTLARTSHMRAGATKT